MNQNYEDEVSLKELFRLFLKRKRVIFLSLITFTLLSGVYAFNPIFEKEKEYDAVSSMSLVYNYKSPENPEEIGEGYVYYQDRLQNIMIPTINGYARSLSILSSIITELDLKDNKGEFIKARELAKDITIENQVGSNIILITVKYSEKDKVADIANKIPEKIIQMAKANPELSNYKITIIDYAVPNELEQISKLLIVAIGSMLGIIMGLFLVFILNYSSKRIQTPSQVRFIGLDIDLILKKPLNLDFQIKMVTLAKLSKASNIIIGIDNYEDSKLFSGVIEQARINGIKSSIWSYASSDFLLKSQEADLSIILVEEDKSNIKDIEEFSKLINKFKINIMVIYVEK